MQASSKVYVESNAINLKAKSSTTEIEMISIPAAHQLLVEVGAIARWTMVDHNNYSIQNHQLKSISKVPRSMLNARQPSREQLFDLLKLVRLCDYVYTVSQQVGSSGRRYR